MIKQRAGLASLAIMLSGCAHLEFSDNPSNPGEYASFWSPATFMVVNTGLLADGIHCGGAAQLFTMNDTRVKHYVRPVAGYGSSNLTASFSNGALSAFGQQTDNSKAVGDVATIVGLAAGGPAGAVVANAVTNSATKASKAELSASVANILGALKTATPADCIKDAKLYRLDATGFVPVPLPDVLPDHIVTLAVPSAAASKDSSASSDHTSTAH